MIPFLLSLALFVSFVGGSCLITLLIIGYREQVRRATESANYNAGLWAESEALRHEAETENARLSGSLDMSQSCYAHMSQIAREAIRTGEVRADVPEKLRMAEDDSILDIGDSEIG